MFRPFLMDSEWSASCFLSPNSTAANALKRIEYLPFTLQQMMRLVLPDVSSLFAKMAILGCPKREYEFGRILPTFSWDKCDAYVLQKFYKKV
jgi:hypothetical protein